MERWERFTPEKSGHSVSLLFRNFAIAVENQADAVDTRSVSERDKLFDAFGGLASNHLFREKDVPVDRLDGIQRLILLGCIPKPPFVNLGH